MKPTPMKPRIIIAQVEGSGTAATVAVTSYRFGPPSAGAKFWEFRVISKPPTSKLVLGPDPMMCRVSEPAMSTEYGIHKAKVPNPVNVIASVRCPVYGPPSAKALGPVVNVSGFNIIWPGPVIVPEPGAVVIWSKPLGGSNILPTLLTLSPVVE